MNWYYASEGQQNGPHSEETIRELAKSGVIGESTLVWRDGMSDWQPASEVMPHLLAPAPAQPPPVAIPAAGIARSTCVECGGSFPASEMITLAGGPVCARCKPLRLQKLREGVAGGPRGAELARLLKVAEAQTRSESMHSGFAASVTYCSLQGAPALLHEREAAQFFHSSVSWVS